jgi:hypothetical protein
MNPTDLIIGDDDQNDAAIVQDYLDRHGVCFNDE